MLKQIVPTTMKARIVSGSAKRLLNLSLVSPRCVKNNHFRITAISNICSAGLKNVQKSLKIGVIRARACCELAEATAIEAPPSDDEADPKFSGNAVLRKLIP